MSSCHLNWDILAQGGLSTSFARNLASLKAAESDFSFAMEVENNFFRRSAFEVRLDEKHTWLEEDLLKVTFAPEVTNYTDKSAFQIFAA